jgi:hypothetical protein
VVCFDLGAPAERVRASDCGMVVKDISAEGMLEALKYVLDHPDLIEYWSHNTARYCPPTETEHIDAILHCLEGEVMAVATQSAGLLRTDVDSAASACTGRTRNGLTESP